MALLKTVREQRAPSWATCSERKRKGRAQQRWHLAVALLSRYCEPESGSSRLLRGLWVCWRVARASVRCAVAVAVGWHRFALCTKPACAAQALLLTLQAALAPLAPAQTSRVDRLGRRLDCSAVFLFLFSSRRAFSVFLLACFHLLATERHACAPRYISALGPTCTPTSSSVSGLLPCGLRSSLLRNVLLTLRMWQGQAALVYCMPKGGHQLQPRSSPPFLSAAAQPDLRPLCLPSPPWSRQAPFAPSVRVFTASLAGSARLCGQLLGALHCIWPSQPPSAHTRCMGQWLGQSCNRTKTLSAVGRARGRELASAAARMSRLGAQGSRTRLLRAI